VGNENWDVNYWRNFDHIRARISAAYPDIKIITTTGPLSSGWINDMAWTQINAKYTNAIVDEHYYEAPSWFLNSGVRRYDRYNRNGAQIFAGEYAAHESSRANTWYSALCEAAYMTGLERNADIVKMASYAPLFSRLGMDQWKPDMIWFDTEKITALTPNYHVQKLFANNTGKYVLPPAAEPGRAYLYQSTSVDGKKIYSKLVNPLKRDCTVYVKYANANISSAKVTRLSATAQSSVTVNSREEALAVSGGNTVTLTLAPYTMGLVQIETN
jgi:alpha-N-arabinofuranosidase